MDAVNCHFTDQLVFVFISKLYYTIFKTIQVIQFVFNNIFPKHIESLHPQYKYVDMASSMSPLLHGEIKVAFIGNYCVENDLDLV